MKNNQKTKHVGSQDYYAQQMTKIHNKYNIIGLQIFLTKIVLGISVLASRKETLNLIQGVVSPLRLGKILTTAMYEKPVDHCSLLIGRCLLLIAL